VNNPVVIVHGWSDQAKSFERLADFLRKNLKTSVTTIDLADWVSMDDEITYRDLRHAMQRAWERHPEIKNRKNGFIISHSTGALVVRDWMTHCYSPETVPFKRHLMLAPANFGSQLAHKGRAWYGRVVKGWKHGFQTGTHLLRGLELASSYSWNLAQRDLFGSKRWYGTDRVMAAALVGNSGYGGMAAATDEEGGDGTVRISTANLNAAELSIDYTDASGTPRFSLRRPSSNAQIALGISDGDNHGSVAFKRKNSSGQFAPEGKNTEQWIIKALTTTPARWQSFVEELAASNNVLYAAEVERDDYFHGYQNTVLKVSDNLGNPVEEYLVEFHRRRSKFSSAHFGARFQRRIIKDVHNYSKDSSLRSFFIDITALEEEMRRRKWMYLELEALPEYKARSAVGYEGLSRIRLESKDVGNIFVMNRTLLVDIKIPRKVGPKAFHLTRHSG
jgi:hypothetical protein